jgi:hypothetical protein
MICLRTLIVKVVPRDYSPFGGIYCHPNSGAVDGNNRYRAWPTGACSNAVAGICKQVRKLSITAFVAFIEISQNCEEPWIERPFVTANDWSSIVNEVGAPES